MTDIKTLLNVCYNAELKAWAANKSWQEIYSTCPNGGWLLSLFAVSNPDDLRLLTLAKGYCANTVRHLMKDARSIAAVDAAIAFGEGRISIEQLDAAAKGAAAANKATRTAVSASAAEAATTAADVILHHEINGVVYTAVTYYAAHAAAWDAGTGMYIGDHYGGSFGWDAAGAIAEKNNQQQTANIVRQYLPIDKWNAL